MCRCCDFKPPPPLPRLPPTHLLSPSSSSSSSSSDTSSGRASAAAAVALAVAALPPATLRRLPGPPRLRVCLHAIGGGQCLRGMRRCWAWWKILSGAAKGNKNRQKVGSRLQQVANPQQGSLILRVANPTTTHSCSRTTERGGASSSSSQVRSNGLPSKRCMRHRGAGQTRGRGGGAGEVSSCQQRLLVVGSLLRAASRCIGGSSE